MADIFNFTDTWNAGGTAFNGIKLAVTNTASAAGSFLLNVSASGATTGSFTVDKSGNAIVSGNTTISGAIGIGGAPAGGWTATITSATSAKLALNNSGFPRIWSVSAFSDGNFYLTDETGGANQVVIAPTSGNISARGNLQVLSATAIPAGGTAGAGLTATSTANFGVFFGSGAPSLSAAKGSLYLRSDGTTTNNRAYINTDGGTTWTAITTVG